MSRFWAGFALASVLWIAAGAGAYLTGVVHLEQEETVLATEVADVSATPAEGEPEAPSPRSKQGRARRPGSPARSTTPSGEAIAGDDLGEPGMRTIDGEGTGGEQQLSSAQINAAFDASMGRIRRCLVLIEGDDAVQGRLTFGARIGPDGRVRAVQLSGPAAATTGEAGACLQSAARAIQFPSFDGPEMLVHYPLTLE